MRRRSWRPARRYYPCRPVVPETGGFLTVLLGFGVPTAGVGLGRRRLVVDEGSTHRSIPLRALRAVRWDGARLVLVLDAEDVPLPRELTDWGHLLGQLECYLAARDATRPPPTTPDSTFAEQLGLTEPLEPCRIVGRAACLREAVGLLLFLVTAALAVWATGGRMPDPKAAIAVTLLFVWLLRREVRRATIARLRLEPAGLTLVYADRREQRLPWDAVRAVEAAGRVHRIVTTAGDFAVAAHRPAGARLCDVLERALALRAEGVVPPRAVDVPAAALSRLGPPEADAERGLSRVEEER